MSIFEKKTERSFVQTFSNLPRNDTLAIRSALVRKPCALFSRKWRDMLKVFSLRNGRQNGIIQSAIPIFRLTKMCCLVVDVFCVREGRTMGNLYATVCWWCTSDIRSIWTTAYRMQTIVLCMQHVHWSV